MPWGATSHHRQPEPTLTILLHASTQWYYQIGHATRFKYVQVKVLQISDMNLVVHTIHMRAMKSHQAPYK
jgi:hypothetical protein